MSFNKIWKSVLGVKLGSPPEEPQGESQQERMGLGEPDWASAVEDLKNAAEKQFQEAEYEKAKASQDAYYEAVKRYQEKITSASDIFSRDPLSEMLSKRHAGGNYSSYCTGGIGSASSGGWGTTTTTGTIQQQNATQYRRWMQAQGGWGYQRMILSPRMAAEEAHMLRKRWRAEYR